MDRQQILDLYSWELGVCFRHPGKGQVPTTHVETIRPAGGGMYDVRACEDCVVEMEEQRAGVARRQGRQYQPGALAGE